MKIFQVSVSHHTLVSEQYLYCRYYDPEAAIFEEARHRSRPWGEGETLAHGVLAKRKTVAGHLELLWVRTFSSLPLFLDRVIKCL